MILSRTYLPFYIKFWYQINFFIDNFKIKVTIKILKVRVISSNFPMELAASWSNWRGGNQKGLYLALELFSAAFRCVKTRYKIARAHGGESLKYRWSRHFHNNSMLLTFSITIFTSVTKNIKVKIRLYSGSDTFCVKMLFIIA